MSSRRIDVLDGNGHITMCMVRGNVAHGAEVGGQLPELHVRCRLRVAALYDGEYALHTLRSRRVDGGDLCLQLTAHSLAVLPGLSFLFPDPQPIDVIQNSVRVRPKPHHLSPSALRNLSRYFIAQLER